MTGPLDRYWQARYANLGEATPLEACPECKRLVGVMAVDGCFVLHSTTASPVDAPHDDHCKMSGKRVPK